MPKRRAKPRSQRLLIAIALGIVAVAIGINAFFIAQTSASDRYIIELQEISDQSGAITQTYEDAIGRWQNGKIDNNEMLQITDDNLDQLQSLLSRLKSLDPPDKLKEGHELSVLSLEYELQSNKHMRNYIETGDESEFEKSSELLQLAISYESKAFASFAKANKST